MSIQNTLKALSDSTRRDILNMLKGGKMSAGEICEKFPVSAAAVSRHLSVLKEADLIRDERDGKFIYYELNASVLEEIMLWLTDLKGGENDDKEEQNQNNNNIAVNGSSDCGRADYVEQASRKNPHSF